MSWVKDVLTRFVSHVLTVTPERRLRRLLQVGCLARKRDSSWVPSAWFASMTCNAQVFLSAPFLAVEPFCGDFFFPGSNF